MMEVFDPFRGGSNALLLSDSVKTLALVLECGHLSMDAPLMCRRLMEVVLCLRFHVDVGTCAAEADSEGVCAVHVTGV